MHKFRSHILLYLLVHQQFNFFCQIINWASPSPVCVSVAKLKRKQYPLQVTQFKEKQRRPINVAQEQTLRTKVCNHIASLKSRQEFEPILGPVIQNAKCDNLHVGNNCWGHWHKLLFTHVLVKAKIPTSAKSVFQLPEDNSLRKHLKALRFKLKCKKI